MTSLVFCAGSVPQVTDRRCVFTASEPPPCPIGRYEEHSWFEDDRDGHGELTGHTQYVHCTACGGSGVAPSGTDIVIWTPKRVEQVGIVGGEADLAVFPAAVVLVGKLDEVRTLEASTFTSGPTLEYDVILSECFLIDPPITEWTERVRKKVATELGTHGIARRRVADLPAGWSIVPAGLEQAIEEAR